MPIYHFSLAVSTLSRHPIGQDRSLVALPFIVSFALLALGSLSAFLLDKKIPEMVRARLDALTEKQISTLPLNLQPNALANLVDWGIDVSQALGAVCSPVIALFVLEPKGLGQVTALMFALTAIASFGLFVYVFRQSNPSRYIARMRYLPCTLVTFIGFLVNTGFLVLALVTVP